MRRARVRHFVYMEIIRGCQMETITSRENAKIKYACRLREEEKLRTADGLFFAEGPKLCLELARGCTLQTLYATEKALAHTEAIILSMTPLERENPQILNASRKKRIAAGCGLEVVDVNRLLKQFDMMQQLTKQMTRGRLSKMGGGGLGSRMHGFGRKKRLK